MLTLILFMLKRRVKPEQSDFTSIQESIQKAMQKKSCLLLPFVYTIDSDSFRVAGLFSTG